MATLFGLYPFLLKPYADGGYQGPQFKAALQRVFSQLNLEIVKRSDAAKTFKVLPKRWIVERWLNRCRRLAKGLGMSKPESPGVPALGLNPAYVKKALPENNMISDRLLGITLKNKRSAVTVVFIAGGLGPSWSNAAGRRTVLPPLRHRANAQETSLDGPDIFALSIGDEAANRHVFDHAGTLGTALAPLP